MPKILKMILYWVGGMGAVGNTIIAFLTWSQISYLWAGIWLVAGSISILICLDVHEQSSKE